MRVASLILGLAAICSPAAAIRTCGAKPPQAFLDASTVLYSKLEGSQPVADGPVEVRAFFHVVTKGPKVQDGNLTEETMRKQFDVLQKEFARYSIQFQLANTTRTINTDWAAGKDELGMKEALRQGSYADLNFYFLPNMGDLLGLCYFPVPNPSPSNITIDGCTINSDTVPGGSSNGTSDGKTAVHEAGHYFGLEHVFGSPDCKTDSDGIDDTPIQQTPTWGCPASKDSCPEAPGLDSIHNFMDYSDDPCMTEFTKLQVQKMRVTYKELRQGK